MEKSKKQKEVEQNASVFFKRLHAGELNEHLEKYALMRDKKIIEFYETRLDARKTGNKFYEDGMFSIQEVNKNNVDLGYFSHALS